MLARELLPERALMGDASAIVALHTDVMRPLADAGPTLIETLEAYLDCGGAIEACTRKSFVHPTPFGTGSSASPPTSPAAIRPSRATPTCCGWRRR